VPAGLFAMFDARNLLFDLLKLLANPRSFNCPFHKLIGPSGVKGWDLVGP
jgi:hypothetical protein